LHRLERTGLIKRLMNPLDGRGMFVELTQKGLKVVDSIAPLHMKNERELISKLNLEEQKQLANLLRKLLLHFETEVSGPPFEKEWWSSKNRRRIHRSYDPPSLN
jgi:hypothetical protein